jgi:hypothetical protein
MGGGMHLHGGLEESRRGAEKPKREIRLHTQGGGSEVSAHIRTVH